MRTTFLSLTMFPWDWVESEPAELREIEARPVINGRATADLGGICTHQNIQHGSFQNLVCVRSFSGGRGGC